MFGLVCLESAMTSQETTVRETHHKIWQVKKNKNNKKRVGVEGNCKDKALGLPTCPPRGSWASELVSKLIPTHLYEFLLGILVRVR